MNREQRAKWERTRAKGMWRFILLNTILFGGALLIGTSIFDYFTASHGWWLKGLYIKAPIYLVGGLVFGVSMWLYGEYKYKKDSSNTSLN